MTHNRRNTLHEPKIEPQNLNYRPETTKNEAKIMQNKPNLPKCQNKRNLSQNKGLRKSPAYLPKNKPNLPNTESTVISVLTNIYEHKPLSAKNETQIMQNKPNFPAARMNITTAIEKTCRNFPLSKRLKNKPNQTQFQTCFSPPCRLSLPLNYPFCNSGGFR
jgi:hypothetical protein